MKRHGLKDDSTGLPCMRQGKEAPEAERARLLKRTTAYKQNTWLQPAKMALAGVEAVLARLNLADNLVAVLQKAGG
jgi:hypothetical protein